MSVDVRLYLAVTRARRAMRSGVPDAKAARLAAGMLDVSAADTLRLAVTAESECSAARLALGAAMQERAELRAREGA
jgi:hypothetical protein